MQVWIEQHGGTLITAAVILLIIVAINLPKLTVGLCV